MKEPKITESPDGYAEAGGVRYVVCEAGGYTFYKASLSGSVLTGFGSNAKEALIDLLRTAEHEKLREFRNTDSY